MSWLFGGRKKRAKSLQVMFTLGSTTVSATLIDTHEPDQPKVLFSTHSDVLNTSRLRYERYITEMVRAVEQVAGDIRKGAAKQADVSLVGEVSFMLASPWYVSKTQVLTLHEKQSTSVTPRLIKTIIDRAEEQKTAEEKQEEKRKYIMDSHPFEKHIMEITLNGYATAHPFGKRANRIQVALYVARMSTGLRANLSGMARHYFERAEVTFHSHALSLYATLRDYYSDREDFLLVEVGEEITDITLVQDNILQKTIAIPVGEQTLARGIAKSRGSNVHEAFSLLCMSAQKNGSLDASTKEYAEVQKAGALWKREFITALGRFGTGGIYPKTVYLSASADAAPCFDELVETAVLDKKQGKKPFESTMLSEDFLNKLVAFESERLVDPREALRAFHASRFNMLSPSGSVLE